MCIEYFCSFHPILPPPSIFCKINLSTSTFISQKILAQLTPPSSPSEKLKKNFSLSLILCPICVYSPSLPLYIYLCAPPPSLSLLIIIIYYQLHIYLHMASSTKSGFFFCVIFWLHHHHHYYYYHYYYYCLYIIIIIPPNMM